MDAMKELRKAHNRIRCLEDRLELITDDGVRLTESCDGISRRDVTIKTLTVENESMSKSVISAADKISVLMAGKVSA